SGTPDERFVQALYSLILNRVASAGELTDWISAIGSAGLGAVARSIFDSSENRIDEIDAIYITLLHRPADANGLISFFNSNADLKGIRNAIEASDEFFNNG